MTNNEFIEMAKSVVLEYFYKHKDATDKHGDITIDDVFVVWLCKTLQNNKALLSTTVPDDMYYELTYNGDKGECYLDVYKKWENVVLRQG